MVLALVVSAASQFRAEEVVREGEQLSMKLK